MSLGVTYGVAPENLAQQMNAASDGRDALRRSFVTRHSGALEIQRSIDPSHGVNYQGGSSYSQFLPLLPSNAGLAGTGLTATQDVRAGAMTWEEAVRYVPPVSQTPIPLKDALQGQDDTALNVLKNVQMVVLIAGSAIALWFLMRKLDG